MQPSRITLPQNENEHESRGRVGSSAEIIEIGRGSGRTKFVIAWGRTSAGFRAPPGLIVALEIFLAPLRISEVSNGHNRARDLVEQFRGGFGARKVRAISDVACTDKHHSLIVRRGKGGRSCAHFGKGSKEASDQ